MPHENDNKTAKIKKMIAIMSGKGGVGKSTVSALLATHLKRLGYTVGLLDGDIKGPSIPRMFGVSGPLEKDAHGLIPAISPAGIKIMSMNLLLEHEDDPVIWRGPVVSGVLKQFWNDVNWGELDYLLIDFPPGTGDVQLTAMQSFVLDGVIMVTSPQSLVQMIVGKGVNLTNKFSVPIFGLIENMSYVKCPDCGKEIFIFGESKAKTTAEKYDIDLLAQLPIDPELSKLSDNGKIESFESKTFKEIAHLIATKDCQ